MGWSWGRKPPNLLLLFLSALSLLFSSARALSLNVGILLPQAAVDGGNATDRTGYGGYGGALAGDEDEAKRRAQYGAAARLAAEVINADATLLPGHTLSLDFYDNQGVEARSLFQTLQATAPPDAVHALVGAFTSRNTYTAQLAAAQKNVPQVSPASTNTELLRREGANNPYLVRAIASDDQSAVALLEAMSLFGWRVAALVSSSDAYGTSGREALVAAAPDRNVDLVPFDVANQSPASVVAAVEESGLRVALLFAEPDTASAILRAAKGRGSTTQWVVSDWLSQRWEGAALDAADLPEGAFGVAADVGTGAAAHGAFIDAWAARDPETDPFGYNSTGSVDEAVDEYSMFVYDSVFALAHAATAADAAVAGSFVDGEALMAALDATSFAGATGNVSFRADGDRADMRYKLVNIKAQGAAAASVTGDVVARGTLVGGFETLGRCFGFVGGRNLTALNVAGTSWAACDDPSNGSAPPWDGKADATCIPGLYNDGSGGSCKLPDPPAQFAPAEGDDGIARCPCLGRDRPKFVMVTHGNYGNGFWSVVEDAATRAAADLGVDFSYRCAATYDLAAMSELIFEAVAEKPDALAVSIPDLDALGPAVRAAVAAGIPTMSLNSGSDVFESLGLLAHFGQVEYQAGEKGCARLAALGATKVLIIDVEQGLNAGLVARSQGCQASGLATSVLFTPSSVDGVTSLVFDALDADPALDAVLGLNAEFTTPGVVAYMDANPTREIKFGVFDFGPATATAMEEGRVEFAIDQQQYLQGYLPVVYMTLMNTTGMRFQPEQFGGLVFTGPGFITIDSVAAKKCETYGVAYCGDVPPVKDNEPVPASAIPPECPCIQRDAVEIALVTHRPRGEPVTAAMLDGARHAAADQGVVLTEFTTINLNKATTLLNLDAAIANNPYGILSTVPEGEAASKLEAARGDGIKVVSFGASAEAFPAATDLFVGIKPTVAGRVGGERIGAAVATRGAVLGPYRVLCLDPSAGEDESYGEKCEGLRGGLTAAGTSVETVSVDSTNPSFSSKDLADQIQAGASAGELPVGGILAPGQNLARIATLVVDDLVDRGVLNQQSDLVIAALDFPEEGTLSHPSLVDVVLQAPYLQGYLAVTFLALAGFNYNSVMDANDFLETAPYQSANFSAQEAGLVLLQAQCEAFGWETCAEPCPAGQVHDATGECVPCNPGTYRATVDDEDVCTPCAVGEVAPNSGSRECTRCRDDSAGLYLYQDEEGQASCKQCPENAARLDGSLPGINVTECMCEQGYWRIDQKPGLACDICPSGAECRGGIDRPFPKEGFWGAQGDEFTGTFMECNPASVCVGGVNHECSEATTGRLCSACSDLPVKHFSLGGSCTKCPESESGSMAMTLLSLVGVLSFWYVLNAFTAGNYDAVDIGLLYLQVLSTIQSMALRWPSRLDTLSQMLAIVNFDLDFVSPNCSFGWGFNEHFWMILMIPLLVATIAGLCHVVAGALPFCYKTHEEMAELKNVLISKVVSFLVVVYNGLTITSLQPFNCVSLSESDSSLDSRKFSSSGPTNICGEPAHMAQVVGGSLGIIFYVIGIPVFFFLMLRYGRKNKLLHTAKWQARVGFLYMRYEPQFYWWELMLLMRRLVVSVVLVAEQKQPMFGGLIVIAFLTIFLSMQFYALPFKVIKIDILDCTFTVSLVFYTVSGLLFYNGYTNSDNLALVLWFTTFLGIAVMFEASLAEFVSKAQKSAASHVLQKRLMQTANIDIGDIVDDLVDNHISDVAKVRNSIVGADSSKLVVLSLHELNERISAVGGVPFNPFSTIFQAIKADLGLPDDVEMYDKSAVDVDLAKLENGLESCRRAFKDEKFEDFMELAATIRADALYSWIKNESDPAKFLSFSRAAFSTNHGLGDTSNTGIYSFAHYSTFMNELVMQFPVLLEWALNIKPEEEEAARKTFVSIVRMYCEAQEKGDGDFMLTQICDPIDRGSIMWWTLFADGSGSARPRETLRSVLNNVARFSVSKAEVPNSLDGIKAYYLANSINAASRKFQLNDNAGAGGLGKAIESEKGNRSENDSGDQFQDAVSHHI